MFCTLCRLRVQMLFTSKCSKEMSDLGWMRIMINWFKINSISYGWFKFCIGSCLCEASDFLGYDMPQKFLSKVIRVIEENTEEWLYLMNEPGALMLHIYRKDEKVHFVGYGLHAASDELNREDESAEREKYEQCLFAFDAVIQNVVDGIVTEFSLYENGNGRMLYEKHWGGFPVKEFEELKEFAFQLQKNAGKYNGLLCTTFLERRYIRKK